MKSNSPTVVSSSVLEPIDAANDNENVEAADASKINFETMSWWRCGMVMIAETISLGILALPGVLKTVGLIPGCLLILGLGGFASYSGCESMLVTMCGVVLTV